MSNRPLTRDACHVVAGIALAMLATASIVEAQSSVRVDGSAALKARARVSADSAIARARRAVPNGRIRSAELEEEHGKLVYSFDIEAAGKPGIEEVQIDAITGIVVSHEHESAAAERAEAKEEARKKAVTAKRP